MPIKRLSWTSLRSLGNSRLIRTSFLWFIFVPIIARILVNFPESFDVVVFGNTVAIPFCLPFRWTLFYFMSVAFALAQVMYLLQCPKFIKNYTNFADYQLQHRGMYILSNQLIHAYYFDHSKNLESSIVSIHSGIGKSLSEVKKNSQAGSNLHHGIQGAEDTIKNDIFDVLVDHLSKQNRTALLLSALLFAFGILFFIILSAQSFWTVIKAV